VEDWKGVEETQQQGTMDGSIVAQAVILYMKDKDRVELSAAKLHAAIVSRVEDDLDLGHEKSWPKTGRTLWRAIREVTPLLEVHGIRAHRAASNKAGRPIILNTDFEGGGPEDDNYAKHTDDKGDDNRAGGTINQGGGTINYGVSSPRTTDTYADGGDNAGGGRYFGPSLALHTLIKKEESTHDGVEGTQGESNPDLSSPSSPSSAGEDDKGRDESPTAGQLQRIRKLVGEGMKEEWAREAVLGKGWGRQ
jgi:hypothetical protein